MPGPATGEEIERAAAPVAVSDPGRILARLADTETREAARTELLDWIRGLAPDRAALWLHLAASLDRLPTELGLAAALAVLQADGGGEEATTGVGVGLATGDPRREAGRALGVLALRHPPGEQAVLLALAARILDPVEAGSALFLRQRYLALAPEEREEQHEQDEQERAEGGQERVEGGQGWRGPEAAEVVISAAQALLAGVAPSWRPVPGSSGEPASSRARTPMPSGDEAAADPGAAADAASLREEALRILETFLAQEPMHPLAPEARRIRAAALEGGNAEPAETPDARPADVPAELPARVPADAPGESPAHEPMNERSYIS